jgi:outer membrane protein TolC
MKAGISFSVPLNRWEATGRRDVARAKIAKLDQDRELLRRQVVLEVEDAASAVNTTEERYRAAVEEVQLAVRLEEGERIRFRVGDSTLFLVNQRERATAEARARLIDVMAEYHQGLAAFRAASADL